MSARAAVMEPTSGLLWGAYATGVGAIIGLIGVGTRIVYQVGKTREHAEQVPAIKEDVSILKSDINAVKMGFAEANKKLERVQHDLNELDDEFTRHQTAVAVATAETRQSVKVAEGTAVEIKTELRSMNERLTRMVEEIGGMKEAVKRKV